MSRLIILVVVLTSGCMRRSDKYCQLHDDPRCTEAMPDASLTCTSDDTCMMLAATPFCDLSQMTCVECRDANDCRLGEPVCGSDKACHGCTQHADCPSDACLPDGTCGTAETVAYVAADGSSGPCTLAEPCAHVSDALALGKPYVKLEGTVKESVQILAGSFTFLAAPGARLRQDSGVVLEVRGAAQVKVYDLTIGGPADANVIGVSMPAGTTGALELHRVKVEHCTASGGALQIAAGGFTLDRSIISQNLGGGLAVGSDARFTIRNNFIVANGKGFSPGTSTNGGVVLLGSDSIPSAFEYNTVATNGSSGAVYRGGATCAGTAVSAVGNIFYGNSEANMVTDATQVGGTCALGNSFSRGAVPGDLGFDLTAAPGDYHLGPSAIEVLDVAGDCTASTREDIDGQERPFGPACDLGADEYRP